tara:strand:+ start:38884 stop:39054 length:171 start_codon:yes stop_codon:yes gene_type:complete
VFCNRRRSGFRLGRRGANAADHRAKWRHDGDGSDLSSSDQYCAVDANPPRFYCFRA